VPVLTRVIGNDEGDVYCDICGTKDWFQAVVIVTDMGDGEELTHFVCSQRYEGTSCLDLMLKTRSLTGVNI
jgi:hypothetical protein